MLPTISYGFELVCFFVFFDEIEIVEWKCLHGFKFITMFICNKGHRIIVENIHKYKGVCQVGLCLGTKKCLNGLTIANQDPSMHHPLDAYRDSIADEPQLH
jgi:hypothetical protein